VPLVRGCRVPWCPHYRPCPRHPDPPLFASYPPLPPGWKAIRARQLAAFPLCEDCGAVATQVDHRHGRAGGDGPANLRSLCARCHARRTGLAGKDASG
jgi:5-methylcytosine-specific restriction endonuclease McrA